MKTLFVCECGDVEHQFVVDYDNYYNDSLYIQIHLASLSFIKRLKYGIQYIFGKKSSYGHGAFAEVLLDKKQTRQLIEVLQNHYSMMNKDLEVN